MYEELEKRTEYICQGSLLTLPRQALSTPVLYRPIALGNLERKTFFSRQLTSYLKLASISVASISTSMYVPQLKTRSKCVSERQVLKLERYNGTEGGGPRDLVQCRDAVAIQQSRSKCSAGNRA